MSISEPSGTGYKGVAPPRRKGPKFEFTKQQFADMKIAFDIFDKNGTGRIEAKDIKVAIRALGFEPSKEDVKKMIAEIDREGLGIISFEDFLALMAMKMAEKDCREDNIRAFQLFDSEHSGRLTVRNLQRVARELEEHLTDEELQAMIEEADKDGDGEVKLEDFLRIMKRTVLTL